MTHNLSKEQLLLLQHNLTYEVYEKFMSLFHSEEEYLPTDTNERNEYILNTMKSHEHWGKIHGWGENRVYCYLPKKENSIVKDTGPHKVYELFKGKTRKELLIFLDELKKFTPKTYIPSKCIPVDE